MTTLSGRTMELDLRGQVCPVALMLSLKKLNALRGELVSRVATLRILTENRDSVPTISEAAQNMGYAVTVHREEAHYVLFVESAAAEGTR
ncbi:MAG TPA: sulfurtransferase TusA family protein [Candidatus Methylomirabilis sp.]|nr:sulfurtransferase TusA family protein [Candidatus Methylomirabilis sp.]